MINWKEVQQRLNTAADGKPGPLTYAALMRVAAGQRVGSPMMLQLGKAIATHADRYGLTTAPRLCEYVAQTCNETGGFTRFIENLNYTATQLRKTWPARFTEAEAARCAHQPELIANKVYGGRMGNTAPGEGWRYRGRGPLQTTGRAGYEHASVATGLNLVEHPERLTEPDIGTIAALDFFVRFRVWGAVDAGDYTKARRITNGGAIGLAHVASIRNRVLPLFT